MKKKRGLNRKVGVYTERQKKKDKMKKKERMKGSEEGRERHTRI